MVVTGRCGLGLAVSDGSRTVVGLALRFTISSQSLVDGCRLNFLGLRGDRVTHTQLLLHFLFRCQYCPVRMPIHI